MCESEEDYRFVLQPGWLPREDKLTEPMYLPEVEKGPGSGAYARVVEMTRKQNLEPTQILHLFAYKPGVTDHLARMTQAILRGPSPLSPGMRELMAAFTSAGNGCHY